MSASTVFNFCIAALLSWFSFDYILAHRRFLLKIFNIPIIRIEICMHSRSIPFHAPFDRVLSVGAMHPLSKGRAICTLSFAAGISLAAAMKFSRCKIYSACFGAIKKGGGFDLSPDSP